MSDDIAYKIAVEMFGKEKADAMRDAAKAAPAVSPAAAREEVFGKPTAGGYAMRSPTGSMQAMVPVIPPDIARHLGPHGSLNDSLSGEPVGYGWPVITHMGEVLFEEAKGYGNMIYDHGNWYLIYRFVTREEAIKKYGPVTNEEFGPRGGWRSVTFGSTSFKHKCMKPSK